MSRAEIEELRLQISALRVRVFAQEERIEELERRVGEGQRTPSSSVAPSEVQRAPPSEVGSGVGSYSLLSGSACGSGTGPVTTEDHEGRVHLAKQCGCFLRRALQGDFRGSSGRDRLRLPSRHYVVAKSFEGEVFEPVRIFDSFTQVRAVCKRDFSCGQAVFLGFATKWELRLALEAGEFTRPPGL